MSVFSGPNVVTDGLVLCIDAANPKSYPGSGTTWFDVSGNGRNLTLFNGTSYNSAGYFDFDGIDDYAQTSINGLGTGASIPHSLEMWVNFNTMTSPRWWLAVIGQFNTGAHHWIGTTTTQFGAWSAVCQRTPTLSPATNWMQIVGTFDGTTLTYYVNSVNTGGSCAASGFNFTNTDFTIGLRIGAEAYFNGKVAVSSIYNRALSATEITQNFNALRGRYGI
jgi:hypothetical protein